VSSWSKGGTKGTWFDFANPSIATQAKAVESMNEHFSKVLCTLCSESVSQKDLESHTAAHRSELGAHAAMSDDELNDMFERSQYRAAHY
jgi:hypothetical protein